jgi:hypothetical protein
MLEFQKWYDEQWWPRYHTLLGTLKEFMDVTVPWKSTIDRRINEVKSNLDNLRVGLYGNGQIGYVERKIREELSDLDNKIEGKIGSFKESMSLMISNAVRSEFDKMKEKTDSEAKTKVSEKKARSWQVVFLGITILLNGAWRAFEFFYQRGLVP